MVRNDFINQQPNALRRAVDTTQTIDNREQVISAVTIDLPAIYRQ